MFTEAQLYAVDRRTRDVTPTTCCATTASVVIRSSITFEHLFSPSHRVWSKGDVHSFFLGGRFRSSLLSDIACRPEGVVCGAGRKRRSDPCVAVTPGGCGYLICSQEWLVAGWPHSSVLCDVHCALPARGGWTCLLAVWIGSPGNKSACPLAGTYGGCVAGEGMGGEAWRAVAHIALMAICDIAILAVRISIVSFFCSPLLGRKGPDEGGFDRMAALAMSGSVTVSPAGLSPT